MGGDSGGDEVVVGDAGDSVQIAQQQVVRETKAADHERRKIEKLAAKQRQDGRATAGVGVLAKAKAKTE